MLSQLSYFVECGKMPRRKRHQSPKKTDEPKKTDAYESPNVVANKYVLARLLHGMPYCVWPVEVVGDGVFCRCDNIM